MTVVSNKKRIEKKKDKKTAKKQKSKGEKKNSCIELSIELKFNKEEKIVRVIPFWHRRRSVKTVPQQ